MPTRSFALRLDLSLPRHKQAVWTTHWLVNTRSRWMVERLLLIRGDEVWTTDEPLARTLGGGDHKNDHDLFVVTPQQVQAQMGALLQTWGVTTAQLPVAIQGLQALYDLVVPTHREATDPERADGDSGTLAKKWLKPLVDSTSVAFETEQRMAVAPPWLLAKREGKPWEKEAAAWRESVLTAFDERRYTEVAITAGYSKAAWFKVARDKKALDAWVPLFEGAVTTAEQSPIGPTVARLRSLGILDCFRDYLGFNKLLGASDGQEMSKWDYLCFTRALARLLSWESWNHRVAAEHQARKEALLAAEKTLVPHAEAVALLRRYEKERTKELEALNLLVREKGDTDFRLGARQVRKWEALADRLRRLAPGSSLLDEAGAFQTEHPRECPDPYFCEWVLSQPSAHLLWSTDSGVQAVSLLARTNRLETKCRKSRARTAMTPPDAWMHPVWLQYEEPSGGNFKTLRLAQGAAGSWNVHCDLIEPAGKDYKEFEAVLPLRPSAQVGIQEVHTSDKKDWTKPGKTPVVTFVQAPSLARMADRAAWETWRGSMQSPDILLDRTQLEAHQGQNLGTGELRADLKLVLDLEPQLVEGQGIAQVNENGLRWSDAPKWAYHLQTSLAEASKHQEALAEGQRFLAVDLGVRDLAAVALFEIRKGEVQGGELALPLAASEPWKALLVEGSQRILSLPGEEALLDEAERKGRRDAEDQLYLLKYLKRRRTRLLALAHPSTKPGERKRSLDSLQPGPREVPAQGRHARALEALLAPDHPPTAKRDQARGSKRATQPSNLDSVHHPALRQAIGLEPLPDLSSPAAALQVLQTWDEAINGLLRVWRDRTRRRDAAQGHLHGKSLWSVEHLGEVRDLLKGWNRRGQVSGEINRPGRDFAKTLLEHVNQLKDDRLKEGANLLVNTARGLVYDPGSHRWEKRFPPAHLILFEDLNRYRFLTDRTPAENSQLMRWCHRELAKLVAEMGQLVGIGVLDTDAAFSSQYCGWSGAPGVRARAFTREELDSSWFQARWKATWTPVEGQLLPWPGGKVFCTLEAGGELVERDADENAALSLARRFTSRHGEAFRLVCRAAEGGHVPVRLNKRQLGGLRNPGEPRDKGYGWLVPEGKGFRWDSLSQKEWEKRSGAIAKEAEPSEPEDDQDAVEQAQELAAQEAESLEAASGRPVVFFRDPSGSFFPSHQWLPAAVFWPGVRGRILEVLRKRHQAAMLF